MHIAIYRDDRFRKWIEGIAADERGNSDLCLDALIVRNLIRILRLPIAA